MDECSDGKLIDDTPSPGADKSSPKDGGAGTGREAGKDREGKGRGG